MRRDPSHAWGDSITLSGEAYTQNERCERALTPLLPEGRELGSSFVRAGSCGKLCGDAAQLPVLERQGHSSIAESNISFCAYATFSLWIFPIYVYRTYGWFTEAG